MDGDQRSKGSLAAFDLLAGERFGDEVQAGATVLLRDHDAEQAELGHPLDRRHVQTVRNVVLDCVGKDALVDERSYRVLDESLLVEGMRSEEHTSELQSHSDLVCRL